MKSAIKQRNIIMQVHNTVVMPEFFINLRESLEILSGDEIKIKKREKKKKKKTLWLVK